MHTKIPYFQGITNITQLLAIMHIVILIPSTYKPVITRFNNNSGCKLHGSSRDSCFRNIIIRVVSRSKDQTDPNFLRFSVRQDSRCPIRKFSLITRIVHGSDTVTNRDPFTLEYDSFQTRH